MLQIQVLGTGVIPRKGFLAPHKEPFPAELQEIGLIMREPKLSLNYLNPDTNEFVPLTRNNLMSVWNKYGKKRVARPSKMMPVKSTQPPVSPTVPEARKVDTKAVKPVTVPADDIIIPKPAEETVVVPTEPVITTTVPNDDIVLPKPDMITTTVPNDDIVIKTEKVSEVVIEDKIVTSDTVEETVEQTKEEKPAQTFTPKYGKKKNR